jgi:hypothetical protein
MSNLPQTQVLDNDAVFAAPHSNMNTQRKLCCKAFRGISVQPAKQARSTRGA